MTDSRWLLQQVTANNVPRIGAVVLAAGASTRMGSPKQLIIHEGKPLVIRAAAAAVKAGADPVVVVLGANSDQIETVLTGLPEVIAVVNPAWETGLASSLAAGLRAALDAADCDGVLVTLADQPLVDAEALKRLIAAFGAKHRIVASAYNGTVGVPALFGKEYLPSLMRLTGDTGAGPWLRSRLDDVTLLPLEGAALDLDTPPDAARLAGGPSSR